jgi:hypothetical protein
VGSDFVLYYVMIMMLLQKNDVGYLMWMHGLTLNYATDPVYIIIREYVTNVITSIIIHR